MRDQEGNHRGACKEKCENACQIYKPAETDRTICQYCYDPYTDHVNYSSLDQNVQFAIDQVEKGFPFQSSEIFQMSLDESIKMGLDRTNLTYGEISIVTFNQVLEIVSRYKELTGVFYDLGCGSGKSLLVAYFLGKFQKIKGIEILGGLLTFAQKAIETLQISNQDSTIELINADMLKYDCSDADIIYFPSTVFTGEFMQQMQLKFLQLKAGSIIVVLKQELNDKWFRLVEKADIDMSWGIENVLFYVKIQSLFYILKPLILTKHFNIKKTPILRTKNSSYFSLQVHLFHQSYSRTPQLHQVFNQSTLILFYQSYFTDKFLIEIRSFLIRLSLEDMKYAYDMENYKRLFQSNGDKVRICSMFILKFGSRILQMNLANSTLSSFNRKSYKKCFRNFIDF